MTPGGDLEPQSPGMTSHGPAGWSARDRLWQAPLSLPAAHKAVPMAAPIAKSKPVSPAHGPRGGGTKRPTSEHVFTQVLTEREVRLVTPEAHGNVGPGALGLWLPAWGRGGSPHGPVVPWAHGLTPVPLCEDFGDQTKTRSTRQLWHWRSGVLGLPGSWIPQEDEEPKKGGSGQPWLPYLSHCLIPGPRRLVLCPCCGPRSRSGFVGSWLPGFRPVSGVRALAAETREGTCLHPAHLLPLCVTRHA